MKRYNLRHFFLILCMPLLTSCAIKILPTFVNPVPSAVYHKNKPLVSLTAYPPVGNLEYQKSLNENLDVGGIIYGAWSSDTDTELESNINLYGFVRQWFKSEGMENPWGNVHLGCQLSYSKFSDPDIDSLISTHIDLAFMPGIYRKNFNLGLALRGGVGATYPIGYYIFLGAALESNFFVSKNLGLGLGIDFTFGPGVVQNIAPILAVPQIFKLSLLYRF